MATHSSILAWTIPWTEEPGGLQFIGLQRARHDWTRISIIILLSTKVYSLFRFPWVFFTYCQYSIPGFHSGYQVTFNSCVSLGSSWLWQFLKLPLFFMILMVLGYACKYFEEHLSTFTLCFSYNQPGLINFMEKDHRTKVPLHPIMSRVCVSCSVMSNSLWPHGL